jgi:predicted thioredoxin/glutaredoxin
MKTEKRKKMLSGKKIKVHTHDNNVYMYTILRTLQTKGTTLISTQVYTLCLCFTVHCFAK